MVELIDIEKRYGSKAVVDGISLGVPAGSLLVLLGKSGCGKTTTLKMINRLIEPTAGHILLDGQDVQEMDPIELRRGIGYVVQDYGLFPHFTVLENIGAVLQLLGRKKAEIQERARLLLELLDLPPDQFHHKYPAELSGGQQQRVAIARALAASPPLLLMDEPFSALDPLTRTGARQKFKEIHEKTGTTTIMVTHDIAEAIEVADQVCLMDQGQVRQLGRPEDLIFRPQSAFVREFFNENRLEFELQVLTMDALLPYLHFGKPDEEPLEVELSDPLYAVLERVAQSDRHQVALRNQAGKIQGVADQADLLGAYSAFKKANGRHD